MGLKERIISGRSEQVDICLEDLYAPAGSRDRVNLVAEFIKNRYRCHKSTD